MRKYINLIESEFDDSHMDREAHVEKLIRFAFDKVGLQVNYSSHAIFYDDATRQAEVSLEDNAVSLSTLWKLHDTGLAEGDYNVEHGRDSITITFKVKGDMDFAQIPSE